MNSDTIFLKFIWQLQTEYCITDQITFLSMADKILQNPRLKR